MELTEGLPSIAEWTTRLRELDSENMQGRGTLMDNSGRMCCLGVLCRMINGENAPAFYDGDWDEYVADEYDDVLDSDEHSIAWERFQEAGKRVGWRDSPYDDHEANDWGSDELPPAKLMALYGMHTGSMDDGDYHKLADMNDHGESFGMIADVIDDWFGRGLCHNPAVND